jgi:hypothetical protein
MRQRGYVSSFVNRSVAPAWGDANLRAWTSPDFVESVAVRERDLELSRHCDR